MIFLKISMLLASNLNWEEGDKIAASRSSFSPLPKITIEQAYYELGREIDAFVKTIPKNEFDEMACFKFHKQLFKHEKVIATLGRKAGKHYIKKENPKAFECIEAWKSLSEKQTKAFHTYTTKGEKKNAWVYDFGEDTCGFKHICVVKFFAKKSKPLKQKK